MRNEDNSLSIITFHVSHVIAATARLSATSLCQENGDGLMVKVLQMYYAALLNKRTLSIVICYPAGFCL